MARQIIAVHWKTKRTFFDLRTGVFTEEVKKFGKFTAATAAEKIARIADGYKFTAKRHHGFGGYWVAGNGDTLELLPA